MGGFEKIQIFPAAELYFFLCGASVVNVAKPKQFYYRTNLRELPYVFEELPYICATKF